MALTIGNRPDHGFDEPLGLLSDCHRRIEHFLRVLIAIAKQSAGGALRNAHRGDLEAALRYFATAAPRHTEDEEETLFPRLRASLDPSAAQTLGQVARLEREHEEADRRHQAVDALGRHWLASGSLDAEEAGELRGHLAALQALYERHIELEDRELFPAAAGLLSAEQLTTIGREMAERRAIRCGR